MARSPHEPQHQPDDSGNALTIDDPGVSATTLDEATATSNSTTDSNPKIDDPGPAAASMSGERLFPDWERFQILDFLGAGGMGSVFKARDPRLQRLVAIKFMRVERLTGTDRDHAQRQRFLREAQAQARLDHPHICKMSVRGRNSDGIS